MPGRYSFVIGEDGWDALEFEGLDELAEELMEALPELGDPARVRLIRPPEHPLTLPAVLGRIVNVVERVQGTRDVELVVGSREVEDQLVRALPPAQRPRFETRIGSLEINIVIDDIAAFEADAIVNASNTRLKLGAGVSGAIAEASTGGLQSSMYRLAPIAEGEVAVTGPHGLQCKALLHAATASGDPNSVATAVGQTLALCATRGFGSVALPAVGTGVGGLPVTECARIFAEQFGRVTAQSSLRTVHVVLWSGQDHRAFVDVFDV